MGRLSLPMPQRMQYSNWAGED
eukprot:COSAG02_NODE_10047_length_2038_cov_4.968025_1_plen_21_part_10